MTVPTAMDCAAASIHNSPLAIQEEGALIASTSSHVRLGGQVRPLPAVPTTAASTGNEGVRAAAGTAAEDAPLGDVSEVSVETGGSNTAGACILPSRPSGVKGKRLRMKPS
jgi:hypothetical protein